MTLLNRKTVIKELTKITNSAHDAAAEFSMILENVLGTKNFYEQEYNTTPEQYAKIRDILTSRKQNLPLQQILGKAFFMGEEFFVDKNVLIPRPETEILTKKLIDTAKKINAKSILDIGTGSGCISILAAKNLANTAITAVDISAEALKIAAKNAQKLEVGEKITFLNSDIFSAVQGKFDIIVSNPPYISPREASKLEKEVLQDPHQALFAPDDKGIYFYEKIIKEADKFLNKNACVMFELGINQSKLVRELFLTEGFSDVEIIKDFDGIDRVICAKGLKGARQLKR